MFELDKELSRSGQKYTLSQSPHHNRGTVLRSSAGKVSLQGARPFHKAGGSKSRPSNAKRAYFFHLSTSTVANNTHTVLRNTTFGNQVRGREKNVDIAQ